MPILNKLASVGWLLLVMWLRGLYLHTKLVVMACLAVVVR